MFEDWTKDFARSEEQFHLLSQIFAVTLMLLALFIYFLEVTQHDLYIEWLHRKTQMIHECVIRDSKAVKKQDDLSVEVALSEGRASNDLKEEFVGFKFDLTGSKLYKPPWELRFVHQDSLGTTQSDLECGASVHTNSLIHSFT